MKWFTKAKLILTGVLMLFVGISVQAAVPHITGIDMAGGKPRLSIQSDPGITNQIQCATNLSDANWAVLTNILVAQSNYEFVDEGTASLPRRFYRVAGFPTNDVPPETMALIPGGSFEMGGTFSESYINEFPVHTVYVSAFYMDRCVVTMALWDEVPFTRTQRRGPFIAQGRFCCRMTG